MCARSRRTPRPSPAGRWLNGAVHATMAAMRRRLDLRAAAAVLAEGDVTMNAVAARLGVAKPTLYKLAGSRDELLRTCVETEAERLLGHLHEHDDVVRAVAAYADDSPGGFRLLFGQRGPLAQDAVRRAETRLAELRAVAPLRAAAELGAAAAVVTRARADGVRVPRELGGPRHEAVRASETRLPGSEPVGSAFDRVEKPGR